MCIRSILNGTCFKYVWSQLYEQVKIPRHSMPDFVLIVDDKHVDKKERDEKQVDEKQGDESKFDCPQKAGFTTASIDSIGSDKIEKENGAIGCEVISARTDNVSGKSSDPWDANSYADEYAGRSVLSRTRFERERPSIFWENVYCSPAKLNA